MSALWACITSQVQNSLKRLVQQSLYVNKKFLRETDNRVLRPQELPKAVMSDEERKRGAVLAKKQGVTLLDCPVGATIYPIQSQLTRFPVHGSWAALLPHRLTACKRCCSIVLRCRVCTKYVRQQAVIPDPLLRESPSQIERQVIRCVAAPSSAYHMLRSCGEWACLRNTTWWRVVVDSGLVLHLPTRPRLRARRLVDLSAAAYLSQASV